MAIKLPEPTSSESPETTEQIAAAALAGDEEALGRLLAIHQTGAYATAYRIVGSEPDAWDAVQEACLLAVRAIRGKEARPREPALFGAWFRRIVTNVALQRLRRQPRVAPVPVDDVVEQLPAHNGKEPGEEAERREIRGDVLRALLALPDAQRAALTLREFEDLSYDEIAEALGATRLSVQMLLFRARKNFRSAYEGLVAHPGSVGCPDLAPLLSGLLDGEVSGESWLKLSVHLSHCAHCRTELAELRKTRKIAALIPLVPLPGLRDLSAPATAGATVQGAMLTPIAPTLATGAQHLGPVGWAVSVGLSVAIATSGYVVSQPLSALIDSAAIVTDVGAATHVEAAALAFTVTGGDRIAAGLETLSEDARLAEIALSFEMPAANAALPTETALEGPASNNNASNNSQENPAESPRAPSSSQETPLLAAAAPEASRLGPASVAPSPDLAAQQLDGIVDVNVSSPVNAAAVPELASELTDTLVPGLPDPLDLPPDSLPPLLGQVDDFVDFVIGLPVAAAPVVETVVGEVVESVPTVVTDVVGSVPTVVGEVVESGPTLVAEVVEAVPAVVGQAAAVVPTVSAVAGQAVDGAQETVPTVAALAGQATGAAPTVVAAAATQAAGAAPTVGVVATQVAGTIPTTISILGGGGSPATPQPTATPRPTTLPAAPAPPPPTAVPAPPGGQPPLVPPMPSLPPVPPPPPIVPPSLPLRP